MRPPGHAFCLGGNDETDWNSRPRLTRPIGDGRGGRAQAADKYVVGVSNTLIGNRWREEMICSIKAEAEASGKVSKVIVANRNGGPSE
jgi:ABC-type sugar transport system substrate-binding protein